MGMLGMLINDREKRELEYMIKRELEELLMDLEDNRLDHLVKQTLRDRYQVLFKILQRVSTNQECLKYVLKLPKYN